MESLQKNRLLFWTLLFLVVVNLSALATYFLFPKKPAIVACSDGPMQPGCALHMELNLTDEQIGQVDNINSAYQEVSRPVSEKIKELRAAILDELASDTPDTSAIQGISREISVLQSQLHNENIKHYLELKKVCTPEQARLLSNLYRDLYGCPMHEQGKEMRHGKHGR
jgi:Spy/CpxP family protein refolding chaperone